MRLIRSSDSLEWGAKKPFQLEDAEFAAQNGKVILGHKTGMGKTHIALMAATHWDLNRILILGGGSSASTWNTQPKRWVDTQVAFLGGQPSTARDKTWHEMLYAKEGIWFSTYELFRRYLATEKKWNHHWDLIVCDEAHKLRSRKTQLYEALLRLDFDKFIGMSATWATRGPQDLWAILHLLNPKRFSSYWRFVNTFCYVEKTGFGTEVFGVKNLVGLQQQLNSQFYRSRSWKEIGQQFDPVERRVEEIDMDADQCKVYDELDNDMFAAHEDTSIITPTKLAKLTRLHQVAVLPQMLFPNIGIGAGLRHIIGKIEDDPHTVIYTYFASAIPLIEAALRVAGHTNIWSLRGGAKMAEVDKQVMGWKKTRGVMICSIRFAESFRIDTSNTAYVLGFSWDPNENIQAEGRLRAIDSPPIGPCVVTYVIIRGTIVEAVKGVTNDKARTVSQIFADYAVSTRRAQRAAG